MSRRGTSTNPTAPKTSRREVLKLGGACAAGSVLAGVQVPWVHAADDSTVRLALIGCGGRGRGAAGDAMAAPNSPVKLHAMADLTDARVNNAYDVLKKHSPEQVDVPQDRRFAGFDAYRHAIDCLRPGDVAMLTAYAYCRPVQIEYAVKKGVNVFMEKTFAPDPAGCRRILAAGEEAKKKNIKIAAGLQCRHSVARQALIEKIRAGELGEIPLVRATRASSRSFLAPPPAGTDLVPWEVQQRTHFLWASSGILLELLIHQIDECCWIKDGWPVSATGKGTPPKRPGNCSQNMGDYDIEYTFADGAKAEVVGVDPFATFIFGTKHAAQFSGNIHAATVHIYQGKKPDKKQITWAAEKEPRSPWRAEWKDFLEAIKKDEPYNEVERAIKSNLTAIMGRASCHMGRTLTWQEMLDSNFAFTDLADRLEFGGTPPVLPDANGNWPGPGPGKWTEI